MRLYLGAEFKMLPCSVDSLVWLPSAGFGLVVTGEFSFVILRCLQLSAGRWKSQAQTTSSSGYGSTLETMALQTPRQPLPDQNGKDSVGPWIPDDPGTSKALSFSHSLNHRFSPTFLPAISSRITHSRVFNGHIY